MESGMAGSEFENWNLFYMFLTKEVIQDNLRYKYFVYFSWIIFGAMALVHVLIKFWKKFNYLIKFQWQF
jgi:hypothetical protein